MPSTDVEVQDTEADERLEEENPADIGVFWYNDPWYPGNDVVLSEMLDPVEQNRLLVAAIHGEGSAEDYPEDVR